MVSEVVQVKAQYLVTYELPDPHLENRMAAGRLLKAKGCTVIHDYKHYDPATDMIVNTMIGYVLV